MCFLSHLLARFLGRLLFLGRRFLLGLRTRLSLLFGFRFRSGRCGGGPDQVRPQGDFAAPFPARGLGSPGLPPFILSSSRRRPPQRRPPPQPLPPRLRAPPPSPWRRGRGTAGSRRILRACGRPCS